MSGYASTALARVEAVMRKAGELSSDSRVSSIVLSSLGLHSQAKPGRRP